MSCDKKCCSFYVCCCVQNAVEDVRIITYGYVDGLVSAFMHIINVNMYNFMQLHTWTNTHTCK